MSKVKKLTKLQVKKFEMILDDVIEILSNSAISNRKPDIQTAAIEVRYFKYQLRKRYGSY